VGGAPEWRAREAKAGEWRLETGEGGAGLRAAALVALRRAGAVGVCQVTHESRLSARWECDDPKKAPSHERNRLEVVVPRRSPSPSPLPDRDRAALRRPSAPRVGRRTLARAVGHRWARFRSRGERRTLNVWIPFDLYRYGINISSIA
jgi:hypothetical protein